MLRVSRGNFGGIEGINGRTKKYKVKWKRKKVVYAMLLESKDKEESWINTIRYEVVKKDAKIAVTITAFECLYV